MIITRKLCVLKCFPMVRKDIKEFLNSLPENVTVVAASKYVDVNDMKILLESGIHDFGENRVDSFLRKYDSLKDSRIKWHFIGHLQRNKAKQVINKIDCLHSLDSLELAELINKERNTPLDTFIEVSINGEENKNGVPLSKIDEFVEQVQKYPSIHLVGLMMMSEQNSEISYDMQFRKLRKLRDQLESKYKISLPYLSMGMSEDYTYAIKEGATHIRLGRILFDLL